MIHFEVRLHFEECYQLEVHQLAGRLEVCLQLAAWPEVIHLEEHPLLVGHRLEACPGPEEYLLLEECYQLGACQRLEECCPLAGCCQTEECCRLAEYHRLGVSCRLEE